MKFLTLFFCFFCAKICEERNFMSQSTNYNYSLRCSTLQFSFFINDLRIIVIIIHIKNITSAYYNFLACKLTYRKSAIAQPLLFHIQFAMF